MSCQHMKYPHPESGLSQVAHWCRICSPMQELQVCSLGQEDPLKKGMGTHSSILACRVSWTEEPGGIQFMGSQRVEHNLVTKQQQSGIYKVLSLLLTIKNLQHRGV